MAEAPQQQQQQQHQQEEEEEEEQQSAEEAPDANEGSEEPKESVPVTPPRPLLSMRSMSSVDPDDDSPNMIVYRKVRAKSVLTSLPSVELVGYCALLTDTALSFLSAESLEPAFHQWWDTWGWDGFFFLLEELLPPPALPPLLFSVVYIQYVPVCLCITPPMLKEEK